MKKAALLILSALFCMTAVAVRADDRDLAVGMVKKGIEFYKANGADKVIEEASNPKGPFVDGPLYLLIMDKGAVMLAHPFNSRLIGQPQVDVKDADGKLMNREMLETIKASGKGWMDYKFLNPKSGEIQPKSTYFEKVDDLIFMCGIYRK